MSECSGVGCDHSSHGTAAVGTDKVLDEVKPQEPKPVASVKKPFYVFNKGETFPMRGFNWQFKGYVQDTREIVFECVGMTAAEKKRRGIK